MYEPGKILIGGGTADGINAVGTSKTLDAHMVTNGWQATGSPGSLQARIEHNLVLLPTGEVLAVGGVAQANDHFSTAAVNCPQVWSPSTGSWSTYGDLACDVVGTNPVLRNYHSTAVLLPDARVISAGGFFPNPNRTYARIFCPPCLFKPTAPTQLAPRPVITSLPGSVTWGQVFTICTPNPGAVQRVSLIRAPATTHSFDQNQRYIRLTVVGSATNPSRLFVTAPAGRDDAPPGDYLLFLVGSSDETGSYPEAPSIAEWVRLQGPEAADLCDVVPPGEISLEPDVVGATSILFGWLATADDGVLPPSGIAKRFDFRKSLFPITSEYSWAFAGPVGSAPLPGPVGTFHSMTVEGLFPCTTYHFSLRAEDDKPNLAALPADLPLTTTCNGGGGGEFSARMASDEERPGGTTDALTDPASGAGTLGVSSSHTRPAQTNAATLPSSAGTLVVQTHRLASGAWIVTLHLATDADGLGPGTTAITVEGQGAGGGRDTIGQFQPEDGEDLLGLCALRQGGRVASPGFVGVDQVTTRLRRDARDFVLAFAQHSRLGELAPQFFAAGGPVELLPGDALDLTYEPAADTQESASAWYLLVRRNGTAPPTPFSQRPSVREPLPEHFALYPSEPNPAGTSTLVRFDLRNDGPVRLEVFDLLGRRVVTVAEGTYPAGRYSRTWDLRDSNGLPVRPGVYVLRLMAGAFRAQQKVGVLP